VCVCVSVGNASSNNIAMSVSPPETTVCLLKGFSLSFMCEGGGWGGQHSQFSNQTAIVWVTVHVNSGELWADSFWKMTFLHVVTNNGKQEYFGSIMCYVFVILQGQ
jgi:hypothetical protein